MARNACDVELDGCIVAVKERGVLDDERRVYVFRFITLNMEIVHYNIIATNDKLKGMFVAKELKDMQPYKVQDKLKGEIYMTKSIVIKGILWIDKNLITVTDVKYLNCDIEL